MNKIILTMILVILLLSGIIIGGNIFQKQRYANKDNFVQNNVTISYSKDNEEIYDDCTDEWEGMNEETENEVLQVNSNYEKEEQEKYKLKELDGVIAIYKIKEDGREELYDITDIAVGYLAEDDKKSLNKGIIATDEESLNQLIEDFE